MLANIFSRFISLFYFFPPPLSHFSLSFSSFIPLRFPDFPQFCGPKGGGHWGKCPSSWIRACLMYNSPKRQSYKRCFIQTKGHYDTLTLQNPSWSSAVASIESFESNFKCRPIMFLFSSNSFQIKSNQNTRNSTSFTVFWIVLKMHLPTAHQTIDGAVKAFHRYGCFFPPKNKPEQMRVAFISAKNHKRQRRKRQSVTAKREKSQTPKV